MTRDYETGGNITGMLIYIIQQTLLCGRIKTNTAKPKK